MQESGERSVEAAMAEAKRLTAQYEWMAAAELILKTLQGSETERETLQTSRLSELLSDCYLQGAFQAESRQLFRERMLRAEETYKATTHRYQRLELKAYAHKTEARRLYASFWLEEKASEKRSLLERCIARGDDALAMFEAEGPSEGLAEVLADLQSYLKETFTLATEEKSLESAFEKITRYGERALVTRGGSDETLLRALTTALLVKTDWDEFVLEASQTLESAEKGKPLEERIMEIAAKGSTPYSSCMANIARACHSLGEGSHPEALKFWEAGLESAEKLRDHSLVGSLLLFASDSAFWSGWPEDDLERRRILLEKGIDYASRAVKSFDILHDFSSMGSTYELAAECYDTLGFWDVSANLEERKSRVLQAIELARKAILLKEFNWRVTGHPLSKALWVLASLTPEPEEKKRLLREALTIREETVRTMDRMAPNAWDRGVMRNYLALLKADLSDLETTLPSKIKLLKEAVSDAQECIRYCTEWKASPPLMAALAGYCSWYADILARLYALAPEEKTGRLSVEAHQAAIAYWSQLRSPGRSAEEGWERARILDAMGDYEAAAQAFRKAAENYAQAAEKVPSMASPIKELESYMRAWVLIEEARILHKKDNYEAASECYRKVVDLLKTTKVWSDLAAHYEACSLLEEAEAQSRKESLDAALKSFSTAAETFRAAKDTLEARLATSRDPREQTELREWVKVTDARMQYCLGLVALEEAKVLDRRGEKSESLAKYIAASQTFRKLLGDSMDEQSRRELETLLLFCEAWAKMKEAEMKVSAELYREAAERFTKAEQAATSEKSRLLALGNASICGALERGTSFKRTRDPKLYTEIKRELEAAADSYGDGGFTNEAEWTRATQRLFDALLYLADAEAEREARKKTELYHLAEKHLEIAAKHYGEAGFPKKRDEALRHLERAKEEKELLLTPMEALAESPVASGASVASVAPVSLTRDQALGSERYGGANVVGNLSLNQSDVKIGDDLTVEYELANIGTNPAMLLKLENILPEGFELLKDRITHRVEDGFINMKGRRLDHLKTDEVKVAMKAMRKGSYELRPRILFVDEKGNYRSYEFEPASLTVGELGISGWIRGKRT